MKNFTKMYKSENIISFEPKKPFEIYPNTITNDCYISNFSNNNENVNGKGHLIKEFYKDANVLVTGGTGFIGKVLIEKLLRSCDSVKNIYVLLRPKRGLSSEQRYADLIKNPIFDRIRTNDVKQLEKIICIGGDISQPLLGLSAVDRQKLIENVSIVFHSAATVRFNQNITEAANMNTLGSLRLWELCTKLNHLKSVVHVSTAYSNPNLKFVEEKVYPPKHQIDTETFIKVIDTLPEHLVNTIILSLQGHHPNTYTLTKSMAENIVASYHHKLPICIVRPSIVTASMEEPYPGWVDNINGITGIMMEIGRGTISSIMGDKNLIMDLIPVDIVCNTMLAAAYFNYLKPTNMIRVYNCTSGQINPIIWKNFGKTTLKYGRKNPTKYVLLYPNFTYRKNRIVHRIYELCLHFLPAILYDIILRVQGKKPILYNIAKRYKAAADTGEFFAMHEWIFENRNMVELIRSVDDAKDGDEFCCDIGSMDWDNYIEKYMLGIRKYVLKDDIESIQAARSSIRRLYVTKCIIELFFVWIFYIVLKQLCFMWLDR